jgi:acetate kinase
MFEKSSDMRELEDAVARGEERAILTENMYFYRITKYIGAYAAAMGGVDVILFTGGVGENQATARAGVCKTLGFLGVEIDPERNKVRSKEAIISTDNSKVKVVVIPTDEELMIATDTRNPEQQIIAGILKELKEDTSCKGIHYLCARNKGKERFPQEVSSFFLPTF